MAVTISLCFICKNEEKTLGKCLDTVGHLVDEVIVVDTGSTDDTKRIAATYGCKIYDFEWIDDFAAARNYAFSKATSDYIFWLDADDVLLEVDREKFSKLKETLDTSVDAVSMAYALTSDVSGRRNRLVNRKRGFRWIGAVHEYLEVWGNIIASDVVVTHNRVHKISDRNLNIFEQRWSVGLPFSPRDLYYFANELSDNKQYARAREFYQRFLDTSAGWVEDVIAACGRMSECYAAEGDMGQAVEWALRSFRYDTPRAEQCCRLGYYFLEQNRLKDAVYWYTVASQLKIPKDHMAILLQQCWTWLPHLQLAVCFDRMGDYQSAYHHNEIALSFCPNDERMLANRTYFLQQRQVKQS